MCFYEDSLASLASLGMTVNLNEGAGELDLGCGVNRVHKGGIFSYIMEKICEINGLWEFLGVARLK